MMINLFSGNWVRIKQGMIPARSSLLYRSYYCLDNVSIADQETTQCDDRVDRAVAMLL